MKSSVISRKLSSVIPGIQNDDKSASNRNPTNIEETEFRLISDEKVNFATKSKFAIFFKEKQDQYRKLTDTNLDNLNATNEFFNPKLFELISKRLHLISLWSGILLGHFQEKHQQFSSFSRLSNNPVENWFKILKHNILGGKQKVFMKS